jgi:penicillin amidase/acyl-homoserine-lactone acylase
MGQEKRLDRWIERYESFHQQPTNRRIHLVCVPLIVMSLIGLLWCVPLPIPGTQAWYPAPNLAMALLLLASFYYLMLSIPVLLGVLFWFLLSSAMVLSVEASPLSLFRSSSVLFLLAWAGQFYGHRLEGKKPAFLEDLQFLLISPAWLIDWLHQRWLRAMGSYLVACAVVLMVCDALFAMKPSIDFSDSLDRATQYDVQIARDPWGIPHMMGKRHADTAFGLAYAHAEDDFQTIQDVLLAARGRLAASNGMSMAPNDYYVGLIRIRRELKDRFDLLDPEIRAVCQGYADGLNLYASRHVDQLKRHGWPAKPEDLIAGAMHKLPMMFGMHNDIGRILSNPGPAPQLAAWMNPHQAPIGSNFMAVSPSRSSDDSTRACINSHQPWTGPVAWYEAHLLTEEGQNLYGGLFPGSPVVFLGHNAHMAWGHTVNHPDLVDIFELEMDPKNPLRYRVDDQWLELEQTFATLEIRLWRDIRWKVKREVLHSLYGPALRVGDRVLAVRYAGMDSFRQLEQWFWMGQSTSLEGFKEAMRSQSIAMFNTGYADKEGNLFYAYNAMLPDRNPSYDWQAILPGNTRATLWSDYMPFDQLPQVENPPSGFIQNCNSSPFQTTVGEGNPDPDRFSKASGIETWMTNRALRAMELYGDDVSITQEEFFTYKYDKQYSEKSTLRQNIVRFLESSSQEPELVEALDILRQWNGDTSKDNPHAALSLLTFRPNSNTSRGNLSAPVILGRLKEVSSELMKHFGRLDVPWGEVNRLVRGEVDLPLGGGPDTLRAIYGRPSDEGKLAGVAGDCFFQFVQWDDQGQLDAWAIQPFGSHMASDESPHFSDQAGLFAEESLRKIPFTREEVLEVAKRIYRPQDL